MTTYYGKHELEAFKVQLSNHKKEHDSWKEKDKAEKDRVDKELKEYEKRYEAWLKLDVNENGARVDKKGLPIPEPQPPQAGAVPPEPEPPENTMVVYTMREIQGPEEIQMAEGRALVIPPSVIMDNSIGISFAVTPEVFAANYVDTETPIVEPS